MSSVHQNDKGMPSPSVLSMLKLKICKNFNKYLPMFFSFFGQFFVTWQQKKKKRGGVCKGMKRFFWKKLLNVTLF